MQIVGLVIGVMSMSMVLMTVSILARDNLRRRRAVGRKDNSGSTASRDA